MTREQRPSVSLVAVDEIVLEQLVHAATTDAAADDVTPPLTAGGAWTPSRVAWLRSFHRDRRTGSSGPAGEATWAVAADGRIVGSVRLKGTDEQAVFETGVWLARRARGQGIGRAALSAVLQQAAALGARGVRADTTVRNASALAVLRCLGFDFVPTDDGVAALLLFEDHPPR